MDGVIEALYIFDEHNSPVLSHVYTGRPLSATQLLPLYLDQQRQQASSSSSSFAAASAASPLGALPGVSSPLASSSRKQPVSLVYLPNTNPPTLVFSIVHASLLLLLTTSSELEPLLALEFLHRVADVLEEFLGSPLIAGKIENNYDVVAQLLTEMCDAGTVGTTEPNALHELVELEGLVGKLLGSITLPGKAAAALSSVASQAAAASSSSSSSSAFASSAFSSSAFSSSSSPAALLAAAQRNNSPALPWRRANVRHSSNEMYADIVESLSVTLAPSGRPLAAFAQGSIAFNSKVSGMPDILLTLSGPSGKHNLGSLLELPVFHPCVRLARWKERPGELSFIPPDGRFLLAAYEVDLMPFSGGAGSGGAYNQSTSLKMPVSVEVKTNLGPTGAEFEVRASVNRTFAFGRSTNGGGASSSLASSSSGGARGLGGGPHAGSPGAPLLEGLRITVPLPADVRNLVEIRPSRGDAVYAPGEHMLEWQIPAKDIANGLTSFGLRCTVVGQQRQGPAAFDGDEDDDNNNSDSETVGGGGGGAVSDEYGFDRSGGLRGFKEYTYDEPYQQPASASASASVEEKSKHKTKKKKKKSSSSSKSKSRSSDNADEEAAAAAAAAAAAEAAAEAEAAAAAAAAAAKRRAARNKMLMPSSASVSFSVKGWLASGVRIESIVLDTKRSRGLVEGVKPYKGVKYLTVSKGGIELRC